MFQYVYTTRVDYSLTDAMGFMHHSNYARVYENARWEYFRHIGLPYSEIENQGFWIPVIGMELKYHKPAFYDDQVEVTVTISSLPRVKMPVKYTMRKDGEIINEAVIDLAFMPKGTSRACRAPQFIVDALERSLVNCTEPSNN